MSTTLNVKGNRQIVSAIFPGPEVIFKIPDGLDLEDKTVVEFWFVKWGTLHIHYINGEEKEIEWEYEPEMDFKDPESSEIEDADEHDIEYEEDKEE